MQAEHDFLEWAREAMQTEADAVREVARSLDNSFARAAQALLACRGRVVVMGMGKSGHIGGKIAATLASTGTPAFFVHPAEAAHGDLGMVCDGDAVLALGDALAVSLLNARSFTRGDFALSHPAGSLGRRLLLTVADVMHSGDALPAVAEGTPLKTAVVAMSEKSLGMLAVIDQQGSLKGIFTDGDLRRLLEIRDSLAGLTVDEIMKPDPVTIAPDKLAAEAAKLMQQKRIGGLLVTDNGRLVGALNMHDLLRERVV